MVLKRLVAAAALTTLAACGAAADPTPQAADRPTAPLSDSSDVATWTRPLDVEPYVELAGLSTTGMEQLAVHTHAHLDVSVDGAAVPLAAGLGISALNADGSVPTADQMMDAMARGEMLVGYSPLHTHDTSGVVHMEAAETTVFTLGQLIDEWGLASGPDQLGGYRGEDGYRFGVAVDGEWVEGDYRDVVLRDHEEVDLVVARTLPTTPPVTGFDFDAAGV